MAQTRGVADQVNRLGPFGGAGRGTMDTKIQAQSP
jgi:hypothetical protein